MEQRAGRRQQGRLTIARVVGVPVYLSPSWFVFAAFIVLTSAPPLVDEVGRVAAYVAAVSFALLLLLSVVLHEVGHCVVARRLGLPVRSITVTLLAGLTEITEPPQTPAREYAVAVSGPLVSLLLAALGVVALPLFEGAPLARVVCEGVAVTNGLVAGFNLLPGLPLDGGRVLRSALWQLSGDGDRATRASAWAGRVLAVLIVPVLVLWVLPAVGAGREPSLPSIAFAGVLAAFVYAGATASLRRAELVARLPGLTVARLARPALAVPASLPLSEAVRQVQGQGLHALVVVDGFGRLQAVVSESRVSAVPVERRPWVPVGDSARALESGLLLDPDLGGEELLAAMRSTPASEYAVPGDPVRVLVSTDVAAAMSAPVPPARAAVRSLG